MATTCSHTRRLKQISTNIHEWIKISCCDIIGLFPHSDLETTKTHQTQPKSLDSLTTSYPANDLKESRKGGNFNSLSSNRHGNPKSSLGRIMSIS